MMNDSSKQKISPEFAAKLNSYPPTAKVRVIVLLQSASQQNNSHRQNRQERKAAIQAMQDSVKKSWQIVDRLIEKYDGKKSTNQPDALGSMAIEITPSGVNALALSDAVKAIVEDQKIRFL
ncbi:MAG: hypothetical protein AAGE96_13240 [Cyanobacteria bacterium P01_G01_bin.19]